MGGKRIRSTADQILDTAERLVQVRGYNAFSYADIAKEVGVQKASLHHHFATKADLGVALVNRYRRSFLSHLEAIQGDAPDALERLERYMGLYGSVLRRKRMCMCGMLAADIATLPRLMRESISGFFAENELWLTRVLEDGKTRQEVRFEGSAGSVAAFLVGSLEGAMLVARAQGHLERFDEAAARLLDSLRPGGEASSGTRTRTAASSRRR